RYGALDHTSEGTSPMKPLHTLWLAPLAVALTAAPASAQAPPTEAAPDESSALPFDLGVGARIGGYGVREAGGGSTSWQDCRMDGAGLFSTVDFTPNVFSELALDFYQAHADIVDMGMDRMSVHTQAAVGLRMFPDFYVTPYVQLGGGAEWT